MLDFAERVVLVTGAGPVSGKLALAMHDLSGSPVEKTRTYLVKVAGIDFSDLGEGWEELMAWQRVRNCIVHTNGEIEKARDVGTLRRDLTRLRGMGSAKIYWGIGAQISPEPEACLQLIRTGQHVLRALSYKALDMKPSGAGVS